MAVNYKIGELSRRTQFPVATIRYYERQGLLPHPTRTAGNYRLYGSAHLERLTFIRNCRSLDMALEEIRQLLGFRDAPLDNCAAAHALIDAHITHVATRLMELKSLARQLQALRRRTNRSGYEMTVPARAPRECGILDGLERAAAETRLKRKSVQHIRATHGG